MAAPDDVLERLDSLIDELAECDTEQLDAKALLAHGRAVERSQTRLGAVGLSTIAAVDERGVWVHDGAYNIANWLAAQTGTAKTDAGRRARVAGLSRLMPLTSAAHAAAAITFSHVHVMARCLGVRTREFFTDEAEATLVALAVQMTADEFATEVDKWIDRHDTDGAEPQAEGERDELFASRTLGGRVLGRFNLGAERGTIFLSLLQEKVDELFRRDHANREVDPFDPGLDRSPANRRTEAMIELLEQGGASDAAASRRGPAFWILLDPATFAGQHPDDPSDELHELPDGTFVPRRLVEQWLCDSTAARLVLGVSGQVLDLGRAARLANRAQRRALAARDRGCAVPGCDRPPNWCHAHHVVWWEDDGDTDIDNLVLLCSHHHRRVHSGGLVVKMDKGVPRFWNDFGLELVHPRRASAA